MKALVIVPTGEFLYGMTKKLNYFDTVVTFETFQKDIIKANKQDQVGDISGLIGLNKAYKHYKKYLYLNFERKGTGRYDMKLRLKLTNPGTLEEIFIAEIPYDPYISGVNDQNTFYPLFNKLIDFIKRSSKTYK